MLIPVADQRPGVELRFIGGRHPHDEHRLRPEAMEVAQGRDTKFYDCPEPGAVGVICIDGVWHWEIHELPVTAWEAACGLMQE